MVNFFFNSLGLSFAILWRLFPIWMIVAAAVYGISTLLFENPMLLAGLLTIAIGPVFVLIGFTHIRVGLAVLGKPGTPDPGKLVKKAVQFFGLIALICAVLAAILFLGAFAFGKLGLLNFEDARALGRNPVGFLDETRLSVFYFSGFVVYAAAVLVLALFAFSALMVPMAANAASSSLKGPDHEIFWGFGANIKHMFLLSIILTVALMALNALSFTGVARLISSSAEATPVEAFQDPILMAASWAMPALTIGLTLWGISIWFAGTTIAYLDQIKLAEAFRKQYFNAVYGDMASTAEIRALREQRQVLLEA